MASFVSLSHTVVPISPRCPRKIPLCLMLSLTHIILSTSCASVFWIKTLESFLQASQTPLCQGSKLHTLKATCIFPSQLLAQVTISHLPVLSLIKVCLSHQTLSSMSCRDYVGYHAPIYPKVLEQCLTHKPLLKVWDTWRWPDVLKFKPLVFELGVKAFGTKNVPSISCCCAFIHSFLHFTSLS